jgi:hypothetical protein
MTMTTQTVTCRRSECMSNGPATVLVLKEGGIWAPTCDECLRQSQLSAAAQGGYRTIKPLVPASEPVAAPVPTTFVTAEAARRSAVSTAVALLLGEPLRVPAAQARKPMSKTAKTWAWTGAGTLASFILGGALLSQGHSEALQGTPAGGAWNAWGVVFLLLPVLIGIIAVVFLVAGEIGKDLAKERAWKATLTPEQRLGVQAAETAALFAAWAGVHHWVKESNARSAAAYQEHSEATQVLMAQHQQQAQQDQMAADLHTIAAAQHGAASRYDPSRMMDRLNYGPAVIKNFPGHPAPGHQGPGAL